MSDVGSVLRFHSCVPDNSKNVKYASLAYLSILQEVETQTRHFGPGIITEAGERSKQSQSMAFQISHCFTLQLHLELCVRQALKSL